MLEPADYSAFAGTSGIREPSPGSCAADLSGVLPAAPRAAALVERLASEPRGEARLAALRAFRELLESDNRMFYEVRGGFPALSFELRRAMLQQLAAVRWSDPEVMRELAAFAGRVVRRDRQDGIRKLALDLGSRLEPHQDGLYDSAFRCLGDRSPRIRSAAADFLRRFVCSDPAAFERAVKLCGSPKTTLRQQGCNLLFGGDHPDLFVTEKLAAALPLLSSENGDERRLAARAVAYLSASSDARLCPAAVLEEAVIRAGCTRERGPLMEAAARFGVSSPAIEAVAYEELASGAKRSRESALSWLAAHHGDRERFAEALFGIVERDGASAQPRAVELLAVHTAADHPRLRALLERGAGGGAPIELGYLRVLRDSRMFRSCLDADNPRTADALLALSCFALRRCPAEFVEAVRFIAAPARRENWERAHAIAVVADKVLPHAMRGELLGYRVRDFLLLAGRDAGERFVPYLKSTLGSAHRDEHAVRETLLILRRSGTMDQELVPLVERHAAFRDDAELAVAARQLYRALTDRCYEPKAEELDRYRAQLGGSSPFEREAALKLIAELPLGAGRRLLGDVRSLLEDPVPLVRERALRLCANLEDEARVRPLVLEHLRGAGPGALRTARAAAQILAYKRDQIALEPAELAPLLAAIPDTGFVPLATYAVHRGAAPEYIPALVGRAAIGSTDARVYACWVLSEFGELPPVCEPALRSCFASPDAALRFEAARAIAQLAGVSQDDRAFGELMSALRSGSLSGRQRAAAAVRSAAHKLWKHPPELLGALYDEDRIVRLDAAVALYDSPGAKPVEQIRARCEVESDTEVLSVLRSML